MRTGPQGTDSQGDNLMLQLLTKGALVALDRLEERDPQAAQNNLKGLAKQVYDVLADLQRQKMNVEESLSRGRPEDALLYLGTMTEHLHNQVTRLLEDLQPLHAVRASAAPINS